MAFRKDIDSPGKMIAAIRSCGIIPLFSCSVPGWSIQDMTAPGCWFDDGDDSVLGPWDWKVDAVQEGDIAYGKFLGGKAAFATVPVYRELMNYRRSLPRYRMAVRDPYKASTAADRLMRILAPAALEAIREAGALESRELRLACSAAVSESQKRSLGARYRAMLTPGVRKNVMDSVVQFLQMGTWTVIGDIKRVYRGPDLHYNGWQLASHTTPDSLFVEEPGSGEAPFWAARFTDAHAKDESPAKAPLESREAVVQSIHSLFPHAEEAAIRRFI